MPYFAAGYMPRDDRMDRPSFRRVLTDMAAIFRDRPEEVARNVTVLQDQLNQAFNREMRGGLESIQMEMGAIRIGQRFDIYVGGLIEAHRFPPVPQLDVLWRAFLRTGVSQFIQWLVTTTMNNMLLGGLYDHVGGGFFRYTADDRWLVPHFEKSLCDQCAGGRISWLRSGSSYRNDLCRSRVQPNYRLAAARDETGRRLCL